MSQNQAVKPGTEAQESKMRVVDGIQVYARKDDSGRPGKVDAIDVDGAKIAGIADRLQRLGYGVTRQRSFRAGKVFFSLVATWADAGEPPEHPFAEG